MLKLIHIIILLSAPFLTLAQPDYTLIRGTKPHTQDTTEFRVSFGLCATPEMNNVFTSGEFGTEGVAPRLGLTLGINVGFTLGPVFKIRTGIYYGWKGYTHIHDGLVFFPQDTIGPSPTTSRVESQVSYSIWHLPLILQFNPKATRFFIAGGLAWNYQHYASVDQTIYFGNGDTEILPPTKEPSLNFSVVASLGYRLRVAEKIDLVFEPVFKYHFRDYIIAGSNLYNFGLKITLNYHI